MDERDWRGSWRDSPDHKIRELENKLESRNAVIVILCLVIFTLVMMLGPVRPDPPWVAY